jgi:Fur family ferric uptake transcriptional regulator
VLRVIYGTHKHVSADDLFELLHGDARARHLSISRATVYRTLSLLAEGGFVQALDLGLDRGTLYEHTLGHQHHDHMLCLQCGKIVEFHDDRLEQVQQAAIEKHGFVATSHRLNVYGTCAQCAKKRRHAEAGQSG